MLRWCGRSILDPWDNARGRFHDCFADMMQDTAPVLFLCLASAFCAYCNRRARAGRSAAYLHLHDASRTDEPAPWVAHRLFLSVMLMSNALYHSIMTTRLAGLSVVSWGILCAIIVMERPFRPAVRGHISSRSVQTGFLVVALCATSLQMFKSSTLEINWRSPFAVSWLIEEAFIAVLLAVTVARPTISSSADVTDSNAHYSALGRLPTPEIQASLLSLATFSWFRSMLKVGYIRTLEQDDIWDLYEGDTCRTANETFQAYQTRHKALVGQLLAVVRTHLVRQILTGVLGMLLGFSGPFFIKRILTFLDPQNDPEPSYLGVLYVLGLLAGTIGKSLCDGQTYFRGRRMGTRIRAILIGEIYHKSLRKRMQTSDTPQEEGSATSAGTVGQIMNLMQVDSNKLLEFSCYTHYFVTTPLQAIVSVAALYLLLGWSAFVGAMIVLLVVPLNAYTSQTARKLQNNLMHSTDKRITAISEVLQGIRIIKFFAWERKFYELINRYRETELHDLRRYLMFVAGLSVLWYLVPIAITVGTFVSYTLLFGQKLNAATVFTALSLFAILRQPLYVLPDMVIRLLEVKVSVERITKFLNEPEVERPDVPGNAGNHVRQASIADMKVSFERASFTWTSPTDSVALSSAFRLQDLNVTFPVGQLTVVVGPTGSGRTSLLHALLGEMHRTAGSVYLPRQPERHYLGNLNCGVAYVAQQAWLQNATIRDNILFGCSFDAQRYHRVIQKCALTRDMSILPGGDMTEVGEKGVNVSGGQKQRIALARAAYSAAGVVLMDDVLSAVDAPTAKHIFENCITGGLMKNRTRLLVTHAVNLTLPKADYVVVMKEGRIVAQGTPVELKGRPELADILNAEESVTEQQKQQQAAMEMEDEQEKLRQRRSRQATAASSLTLDENPDIAPTGSARVSRIIVDEDRSRGSVTFAVYKTWFQAAGGVLFSIALLSLLGLQQLSSVGQDLWLRRWANAYREDASGGDVIHVPKAAAYLSYYLSVYGALGVSIIVVVALRLAVIYSGSLKASRVLHADLLKKLLHAKVRFYDQTPIGRIINRMSRDIQTIDRDLTRDFGDFLVNAFIGLTIVIVICSVTPLVALVIVPVAAVFTVVAKYFLRTSRELKRIDSMTRSPIYALFSETLTGAVTIRAFGAEKQFIDENYRRVDINHRAFFFLWVSNRWLTVRTDFVGAMVVALAGLFLVHNRGLTDPSLAGLMLSYSLNLTDAMIWSVRFSSLAEMGLTSVERVAEWIQHVEQEPPSVIPQTRPGHCWPVQGRIEVLDLTVHYSKQAQPVLSGVTFSVDGGQKVGIVGRTGAGKSTLAVSFFRFVEASSGSIVIDGVDIATLGVEDLRGSLTIIPQDPVLFSGTIRSNLDMFDEYSDAELWSALRRVHLVPEAGRQSHLSFQALTLDTPVLEGGSNLSVGMRQMLSLCRAILKRSKVIILDEATSSVDAETDAIIQQAIRSDFEGCTMLTIAHRLRTICDFDKVLTLDHGRVVEYDSPAALLRNENGMFRKMCTESGEYETLWAMAHGSH